MREPQHSDQITPASVRLRGDAVCPLQSDLNATHSKRPRQAGRAPGENVEAHCWVGTFGGGTMAAYWPSHEAPAGRGLSAIASHRMEHPAQPSERFAGPTNRTRISVAIVFSAVCLAA
eukprot:8434272-Pyramimonas_sp.AAC.1